MEIQDRRNDWWAIELYGLIDGDLEAFFLNIRGIFVCKSYYTK